MPKLLICGSRFGERKNHPPPPEMLALAQQWVERAAKWNGYSIVVGDAEGIDTTVIETCLEVGLVFTCYGITPHARAIQVPDEFYIYLPDMSYPDRDRHMATVADYGVGIWNGFSHGTIITFNAMRHLGKTCLLYNFAKRDT